MGKDVIIACDFPSKEATLAFLDRFTEKKPYVKIGMELFYSEGPDIVKEIKKRGHKIFLDLKLHDIPNTVEKAMAALSRLDVDMCNVHAAGTKDMMAAAIRGLTRADGSRPLLIAVTQLTSTSQERMQEELLIDENDVQASHAMSMGRVDEEQLYYMMSRGLSSAQCTALIASGYLLPICTLVEDEKMRESLTKEMEERIATLCSM